MNFDLPLQWYLLIALLVSWSSVRCDEKETTHDQGQRLKRATVPIISSDFRDPDQDGVSYFQTERLPYGDFSETEDMVAPHSPGLAIKQFEIDNSDGSQFEDLDNYDNDISINRRGSQFSHSFVGKRDHSGVLSANLLKRDPVPIFTRRAPHYSHSFVGKRSVYENDYSDIPYESTDDSLENILKNSNFKPSSFIESTHENSNFATPESSIQFNGVPTVHNLVKRDANIEKRSSKFSHDFVGKRAPRFGHSFVGKRAPRFGHSFVGKRAPRFGHSFVGKRAPRFGHSFVGKRAPQFGHLFVGRSGDGNTDGIEAALVKDVNDEDVSISLYPTELSEYVNSDTDQVIDELESPDKRQQRPGQHRPNFLGKRPSFTHSFVGKRTPEFRHMIFDRGDDDSLESVEAALIKHEDENEDDANVFIFPAEISSGVNSDTDRDFTIDEMESPDKRRRIGQSRTNFLGKRPSFTHSFVGKRAPRFGHSFVGKRAPGFGHNFIGKRASAFGHNFVGKRASGFGHNFVGKRAPGFGHNFVGKRPIALEHRSIVKRDADFDKISEKSIDDYVDAVSFEKVDDENFLEDIASHEILAPEIIDDYSTSSKVKTNGSSIEQYEKNLQDDLDKRAPRFGHSFVGKKASRFGHSFVGKRAPRFGHSFVGKRAPKFGHSFVGKRAPRFGHSFVGKRAPRFGHSFVGKRAPRFGHSFVGKRAPGFGHSFVGKRSIELENRYVVKREADFDNISEQSMDDSLDVISFENDDDEDFLEELATEDMMASGKADNYSTSPSKEFINGSNIELFESKSPDDFDKRAPRFGHSFVGKRAPRFGHSFVGKRAPRFGHSFVGKRATKFGHSFVGKRAPRFGHSFVGKRAPRFGHSFVGKRAPRFGHSFVGKRAPRFGHSFVGKRAPRFGHNFVGKRDEEITVNDGILLDDNYGSPDMAERMELMQAEGSDVSLDGETVNTINSIEKTRF